MKSGLIRFKGIADGVYICLDGSAPMYEILDELERKINSNMNFFGRGNCRVSFGGRRFTASEKRRLSDLMTRVMPLADVTFDDPEKKRRDPAEWINEYKQKHAEPENDERQDRDASAEEKDAGYNENISVEEERAEERLTAFRSSRARLYQGVVGEGEELASDGHLILLGTAEPGSALTAEGNIIVIGGLYGSAHAGKHGHNASYILAMDMRPEKLCIADAEYVPPDESEEIKDEIEEKHSFFNKFRKKSGQTEISEDITQKSEFSAVALWKNHKIILDNFTIKTFTNLKNMI